MNGPNIHVVIEYALLSLEHLFSFYCAIVRPCKKIPTLQFFNLFLITPLVPPVVKSVNFAIGWGLDYAPHT